MIWRPVLALWLLATPAALASVAVTVGPTPIAGGSALAAGDITVRNEKLAFALAIDSAVPYGVPRGALVDLAPVSHGSIARDRVVFADFIPDAWSAWPNTYRKPVILERGPARAVVRIERDWGQVTITTQYTLRAGSDQIEIQTTMRNGSAKALIGLRSGLTLWPNSGYLFAVPGLAGVEQGSASAALSDRVVAYDEAWTIALHAPYLSEVDHGSRDLYLRHTLAPGASARFDGWLQVGSSGDLAPVLRAEFERKHLPFGTLSGRVAQASGRAVENPVIVVEKSGQPYAWALGKQGHYRFALPVGDYTLYATGRGLTETAHLPLSVKAGEQLTRDFRDLAGPGNLRFEIRAADQGQPLDARLRISTGQQPVVEFLGRRVFYTQLDQQGQTELKLAPGRYEFEVSSGGGFTATSQMFSAEVAAGQTTFAPLRLTRLFDPEARGWYAADLHHHADQAEAVTPPADLARSQLAAGLDLLFVSDHDSLANLATLSAIAARRGVPFIGGVEISPSWGHFNAFPVAPGQVFSLDTGAATIAQVIDAAHRLGATVLQVNHPLIPYGYFTSLDAGTAPGGFDERFDLVEINAHESATDQRVFERMWALWNSGHHYYLSAGSDTHDVWNEISGRVRVYAHVEGRLTVDRYVAALRGGSAYVSYGPLIYPSVEFGETLRLRPGEPFTLGFDVEAVGSVRRVELIGSGKVAAYRNFEDLPQRSHVDFALTAGQAAWYAVTVEDAQGRKAYSNPVWIAGPPLAALSGCAAEADQMADRTTVSQQSGRQFEVVIAHQHQDRTGDQRHVRQYASLARTQILS